MKSFCRTPPRLIVITDTTVAGEADSVARISRVLSAAAPSTVMVQLRDNPLSSRVRLALGRSLAADCRRHGQLFVVNDRADLAILLEADGVHLGEGSAAAAEIRSLLPDTAWISHACHDPIDARMEEVDAVLLSPIVAPRKGRAALGFEGLREARRTLGPSPSSAAPALYALGGVDAESAAACISNGADGVAVIGAVLHGTPPEPLLAALGILRG